MSKDGIDHEIDRDPFDDASAPNVLGNLRLVVGSGRECRE
jgi:hypothetical protein